MSKKLRYLLIAIGFAIFLLLAPIIVLYVRGVSFDFEERKFVQTGILALRAEPKDTEVLIDGKPISNTVKDVKFLLPKEYSVSLRKNGYGSWDKRLKIASGQVTWGSPVGNKIFLFYASPESINLIKNKAIDFYADYSANKLIALTAIDIITSKLDSPDSGEFIPLPQQFSPLATLTAAASGDQFILQDKNPAKPVAYYLKLTDKKFVNMSGLFNTPVNWQFSPSGGLYALSDGQFYQVDPQIQKKTLLQNNVLAAAFLGNDLYMLRQAEGGYQQLEITSNPSQNGQVILKNIQPIKQAEIIVSFEKQIYIIGDGKLYRAASSLEQIAGNVTFWKFDEQESSLIFFHDGELDYINPYDERTDFITRRSDVLTSPLVRLGLNTSFFVENNQVKALELDTRDKQNEYLLYSGTDVKKISLDNNGKFLTVLDGDTLKTVIIR